MSICRASKSTRDAYCAGTATVVLRIYAGPGKAERILFVRVVGTDYAKCWLHCQRTTKRTWLTYVQPYHEAIQATRRGTAAHAQHAAAMAERPRDPEVWAEWGRETRAGTACTTALNISAAGRPRPPAPPAALPGGREQVVSIAVQSGARGAGAPVACAVADADGAASRLPGRLRLRGPGR